MRHLSLIAALPLFALTACGGASGPETAGSVAPPTGPVAGGSGGSGGGVTPTPPQSPTPTASPTPTSSHFLQVSTATTFNAIGSFHSRTVVENGVTPGRGMALYTGNASTVRAPSGTVSYNPRDGIFTIAFSDAKAGVAQEMNFQDPAHRTQYASWGVPVLQDFNYLEAQGPSGSPERTDVVTFFYQRPGAQTTYVSLAGYVRNAYETNPADSGLFLAESTSNFERGAMVFGTQTLRSQVPITGTGRFEGGMLATMVTSTNLANYPSYFQWITGTARIDIDFANSTVTNLLLSGTVSGANFAGRELSPGETGVAAGSAFTATGSGRVDLNGSGGFIGQFASASFTNTGGTVVPVYDRVNPNNSVAGANSIDGAFFGPNAVNVGGNFRIVGGVPDQRVDILGAFTGAKRP
jgi:hypothetical protein